MSLKDDVAKMLDELDSSDINEFFYSEAGDHMEALAEADFDYEWVDSFGGEGQGDQYWSVYKFTRGDEVVYVEFYGWYASYSGAEFTEWFVVKPKEVTVIKWKRT